MPIKTSVGKSTGWMTDSPYGLRVALSTQVFEKPVTSPTSVPSLDLLRV